MKNNTKKTFKIYWQHMREYKLALFVIYVTVIGASVVNVIVPLYFKKFFDTLISGQSQDIIVAGLIGILITLLILESTSWLFWRINTFMMSYFQPKIMADLANTCFQYLHKHSYDYFNNNFVGSLVKRVNRFLWSYIKIDDRFVYNLIPLVVNISLITIILTIHNTTLGLIIMAWVITFLVVSWSFSRYKLKYDVRRSRAESESSGVLADTLTNQTNVKLFCGYKREVDFFGKGRDKARRLQTIAWSLDSVFEAIQGALSIALEIGIMYFGIILWKRGLFTVGDFVLLQSYVLIVLIKIWDFGRVIRHTYQDLGDAEEMTEILHTPHEIVDTKTATAMKVKKGKIEFKNVSFRYRKTRKVLDNFSLTIKPQEKVALVGPSGAGKTTVTRLLLRLYDITRGKILIDGQRVSRVTQESLWKAVSLVPQDPILFHRTLMENIRYGKPEASDEEVVKAAKAAHCHEFIKEFPDGYETYVGERGIKLSGGERQRVAIARAILRNAPILVLDEATSSLDSESEHLIQDALDTLMKDKTVIVIAHRLSTIMKMDRIIVIDEGGIIEQGTHKELLKKKKAGIYSKLWEIQAGGFVE